MSQSRFITAARASAPRPGRLAAAIIVFSLLPAACGPAVASRTEIVSAPTAVPTATSTAKPHPSSVPAVPASPSPLPLPTDTPAPLPTETPTPTAQAVVKPTLGYFNITPAADATLVTPFPTPVNQVAVDKNLVNVLLIGTDHRVGENNYRTDTLIIVSINKESGLVTMLSIPRDLYVYVPTWGMSRINKAYQNGETSRYAGGGPGLLKQTLLYNLGIPIHYYALVNFTGFRQIVDAVGGIDVPVNCQMTEYKIKDLSLDETDPKNYELYTQPIGVTHMDGPLALWYARARPVGGDYFRNYRQRQVLRAIYRAALGANIIPQVPALYGTFKDIVHTDMGLWDVMQFAPLASRLDDTRIRSLHLGPNQTTAWRTPMDEEVLLPRPEAVSALVTDAFSPPLNNQLQRPLTWVEIWNTAANPDLARLAAETLANEGFAPIIGQPDVGSYYSTTSLIDFTTSPKGSPLKKLQSFLHVADANVIAQPEAGNPVQFRVILGDDYNPCPRLDWMDTSSVVAAETPKP